MVEHNIIGDIRLTPAPDGEGKILTFVSGEDVYHYSMNDALSKAVGADMVLSFDGLVKKLEEQAPPSGLVIPEAPNGVVDLDRHKTSGL